MSEIKSDLPIPLSNYIRLIEKQKSPYYDIIQFLLKDMEMHYKKRGSSEVVYMINPRILQEEIEKKVKDEKLTTTNVCRTILAFFYGSKLKEEEDFYVTTTTGGRRNYHVKLDKALPKLQKSLFSPKML